MKTFCAVSVFLLTLVSGAFADKKPPERRCVGEWSDGRGTVLVVTETKLRLGSQVASYKEITRPKGDTFFQFHVTGGRLRGFDGQYFSVEVSREEMRMRQYRTQADCLDDRRVVAVTSWTRDR